jgi:hypothetical protein
LIIADALQKGDSFSLTGFGLRSARAGKARRSQISRQAKNCIKVPAFKPVPR